MYVSEFMKSPVTTVTADTLAKDAEKLMKDRGIRRLPVLDKGRLVGMITHDRLRDVSPSPATSLSVWELHDILSKMRVKEVMVKNVITVTTDTTVEKAVQLAQEHAVGALPVLDKEGNLVGIFTATDLYLMTAQVLSFGQAGARLHIFSDTDRVVPHRMLGVLARHQVDILSAFSVTPAASERNSLVIILNTEASGALVDDLRLLGLEVEVRKD